MRAARWGDTHSHGPAFRGRLRLSLVLAAATPACIAAPNEPPALDDQDSDTSVEAFGSKEVGEAKKALSSFPNSIQSRASNKCLDIPNGSTAAGAAVNQYTCHGGPAQQFVIEGVPGVPGFVRLRNTNSNLCVTPTGYIGYSTPKMPLVQASCSSGYANWTRNSRQARYTRTTHRR